MERSKQRISGSRATARPLRGDTAAKRGRAHFSRFQVPRTAQKHTDSKQGTYNRLGVKLGAEWASQSHLAVEIWPWRCCCCCFWIFGGTLRKKRSWYYCVGTKFTCKISSYEESTGLISSYKDSSDSRENQISTEEIKYLP